MYGQIAARGKCHGAVSTVVGLLARVHSEMHSQAIALAKTTSAFGLRATIGSVTVMGAPVDIQVAGDSETLAAHLARERFFPRVLATMHFKLARVGKVLRTIVTLELGGRLSIHIRIRSGGGIRPDSRPATLG